MPASRADSTIARSAESAAIVAIATIAPRTRSASRTRESTTRWPAFAESGLLAQFRANQEADEESEAEPQQVSADAESEPVTAEATEAPTAEAPATETPTAEAEAAPESAEAPEEPAGDDAKAEQQADTEGEPSTADEAVEEKA